MNRGVKMKFLQHFVYYLMDKRFLLVLFIINLFGTIYGFIWYESQLATTPLIFIPFVPDSPTASLFFTIVLAFFLFNRNAPYVEALAFMSLFKYGIWAVIMNILTLISAGTLSWQGYMLIASHGAMAVQALLFIPHYRIELRHFVVAAIWILHNDIIDYVYEMMPVYAQLTVHMKEIGYFTFWLSIITIFVTYFCTIKRNHETQIN